MRDAKYHEVTTPKPPPASENLVKDTKEASPTSSPISPARERWNKVTEIARRAAADDVSLSSDSSSNEQADLDDGNSTSNEEREKVKRRRAEATELRKKTAKMMDLQYFLEMVDQKHRYGSNLRKYHNYWKSQDTKQNYFYGLDQGDGKEVSLPECSRDRLDKEQVRYLSREERLQYLVKIDKEGYFVWAKNGQRVWTKDELYKDSVNGIVPVTDPSPQFKYNVPPADADTVELDSESDSESSSSSEEEKIDNNAGDEGERYVNEDVSISSSEPTEFHPDYELAAVSSSKRLVKSEACERSRAVQSHDQGFSKERAQMDLCRRYVFPIVYRV